MSRSTLVDSSRLVPSLPSGPRPMPKRPFWMRNGPNRVGWPAARPPGHPTSCAPAAPGDGGRRAERPCRRRRRGDRCGEAPGCRPRVGGLLGERPALEAQAVLVVDDGDVEARLELLAQRLQEGVTFGERQREIDDLGLEADRRRLRQLTAQGDHVSGEVGAVALAQLQRLVVGSPEAQRGGDDDAGLGVPAGGAVVEEVRRRRRLDRWR